MGFLDDYIKIFMKNKQGLRKVKIIGQVVLGLIVGATLFFSEDVIIVEKVKMNDLTPVERIEITDPSVQYPVRVNLC